MKRKLVSIFLCIALLFSFSAVLFGCEEAQEQSKEQSTPEQESVPEEESIPMINAKELPDYGKIGRAHV